MPRDGSGNFVVFTPGNPVVPATTIDPTVHNNTINDIASGLSGSLPRNGEGAATANIPMGGFKLTNVGLATTTGDALSYGKAANVTTLTLTGLLTGIGGTLTGPITLNSTTNYGILNATVASGAFQSLQVAGAAIGYFGSSEGTSGAVGGVGLRSETFLGFSSGGSAERMRITATGVIQDGAGNELGYKGMPRQAFTGTRADRGGMMALAAGCTIPNAVYQAGDTFSLCNQSAGPITITMAVGARLAGTALTGNRTLAVNGIMTLWFDSGTLCFVSGAGVS